MIKKPLYSIGQEVKMSKPNLWKEAVGVIVESEKMFKEIDENGRFVVGGLVTSERSISSIVLPYEFDGETLKVTYPEQVFACYGGGTVSMPERVRISKFFRHSYTIKTEKGLSSYPEKMIALNLPIRKQLK